MKGIRRLRFFRLFQIWQQFFAISNHSERRSIGIDIQGWVGNGGEAKTVLEYSGKYVMSGTALAELRYLKLC